MNLDPLPFLKKLDPLPTSGNVDPLPIILGLLAVNVLVAVIVGVLFFHFWL